MFVQDLRKSDEIAVVARPIAFAEKRPETKRRPGIAFVLRLIQLRDESLFILDAETELCSTDGQKWYEHVERCANKIMRGRPLSTKRAAKMAAGCGGCHRRSNTGGPEYKPALNARQGVSERSGWCAVQFIRNNGRLLDWLACAFA